MAHSPETIRFLQQDMEAATVEIDRLRKQIEVYRAKVEAEQLKVDFLRNLVSSEKAPAAKVGKKVNGANVTGEHDQHVSPVPSTNAKTGFRDAIRTVLRNSSKGMRPKDVTRDLRRIEFEYKGPNLPTRVANELYRMRRVGMATKRGEFYYLGRDKEGSE